MTPEGRVKYEVKKRLRAYGAQVWQYWPVNTGYGKRTVDLHMCVRGRLFLIEFKAPGEEPTGIQHKHLKDAMLAGAVTAWFDDADKFHAFLLACFPDLKPAP